ncbi:hypothetical protein [Lewinella sp. 4G2]|uniref:hypothetical protein n=1 Tax=Lewinella sp. 4G2 TaxID=1803372 RepID=UPI0007B4D920|nr:hypothetical protein [Lewinella sp. 4G2]OAV43177.1 hypothetical protein A3850_001105 [Lewinella sp. 4G2]
MRFFFILAILATSAASFAQDPADIFHKTIDLDSINQVSLDVYANDNFEVKTWPGDDILIETSVKLIGGKPFILKFFKEKQRYDLEPKQTGDRLALVSRDKERRQVNGDGAQTTENVIIVLYMPEDFADAGNNTYRRKSK